LIRHLDIFSIALLESTRVIFSSLTFIIRLVSDIEQTIIFLIVLSEYFAGFPEIYTYIYLEIIIRRSRLADTRLPLRDRDNSGHEKIGTAMRGKILRKVGFIRSARRLSTLGGRQRAGEGGERRGTWMQTRLASPPLAPPRPARAAPRRRVAADRHRSRARPSCRCGGRMIARGNGRSPAERADYASLFRAF